MPVLRHGFNIIFNLKGPEIRVVRRDDESRLIVDSCDCHAEITLMNVPLYLVDNIA